MEIEAKIKLFVLSNSLAENSLDQIEETNDLDLGRKEKEQIKEQDYYKQFDSSFRKEAKEMGKEYVFSLSISPGMWDFFISLGFTEIDRKELPKEWQRGYDFKRNSKAFILHL